MKLFYLWCDVFFVIDLHFSSKNAGLLNYSSLLINLFHMLEEIL